MSTETNESASLDWVKWFFSVLLIASAIYLNHYLADNTTLFVRPGSVGSLIVLALFLASRTIKGKEALQFASESRMEIRKVVWPTRQESIQTTLIIVVFVAIISLFLWGVDFLLALGVNEITGV